MGEAGRAIIVNISSAARVYLHVRARRVPGQQVGSAGTDQDGGVGTRGATTSAPMPRKYISTDGRGLFLLDRSSILLL